MPSINANCVEQDQAQHSFVVLKSLKDQCFYTIEVVPLPGAVLGGTYVGP